MSEPALDARALITIPEARRYCWRDEDDSSRDGILIDAINDISDTIWDEYNREFKPTTTGRSGTDGVTNATTTFTSATAAFVTADVGHYIDLGTKGIYKIASRTNATTVILDGSPVAGTGVTWQLSEDRVLGYDGSGYLDFSPYDLRDIGRFLFYSDLTTAEQVTLTTAQYRLHPTPRARGGTYLGAIVPRPAVHEFEYGFGWQVTVRGFWGMPEVPGPVKLAAKEWIDNIVKNPGQWASNSMSGYTVVPEVDFSARRAGMPPAVRHRLERFRRSKKPAISVLAFAHPDSEVPSIPHSLPVP